MAGTRQGDISDIIGGIDPLRRQGKVHGSGDGTGARRVSGWRGRMGFGGGCRPAVAAAPRRFAVLRVAKVKTLGNLRGAAKHMFRERETHNADPDRLGDNEIWIGADGAEAVAEAWATRAPERIRKNAVHALEYLVTASPEALGAMSRSEQDSYFAQSLDWLCKRHGEENVLTVVVHRDETTPHLTALVIPLDERGHLNARSFTGGKMLLSRMQTDFAETVADWGIERGIHRSNARHVSIREYYAQVNTRPAETLDLPEPDRGGFLGRGRETPEGYAERLRETAGDQYTHLQRNYEKRLQDASEALSAAEAREGKSRVAAATSAAALGVLSTWNKIMNVEEDDDYRELLGEFADEWDRGYRVFAQQEPSFAAEMEDRLAEVGIETDHARQLREEREQQLERDTARQVGRKSRSLDDDDGWGL